MNAFFNKKISELYLIVGFVVMLCFFSCNALTASAKKGDTGKSSDSKWKYTVITDPSGKTNGTVSISPNAASVKKGSVSIPNTIKGSNGKTYNVVKIADYAFKGCSIKSVTIPKNVKTIGKYAFSDCDDEECSEYYNPLTSLTFESGSSLVTIGEGAFEHCSIKSVKIPKSVKTIDDDAFFSDENLTSLTFESGSALTTIGVSAFAYCSIKSVKIPKSVKTIDDDAFWGDNDLTSLTFESGSALTTIGESAFESCSIKSVKIPKSVKIIDVNAFYNNEDLTSLTFESGSALTTIDNVAFCSCSIKSVKIPKSVKIIGDSAFYNNEDLTSLTFESGSALTTIDDFAFAYCSIKSVKIPKSVKTIGECAFSNFDDYLEDYEGDDDFLDCDKYPLTSLTFESGSSITTIGAGAFLNCEIKSVKIPKSIKTIGACAFAGIDDLTSLTFESGSQISNIGDGAFFNTGISYVVLPDRYIKCVDSKWNYAAFNSKIVTSNNATYKELYDNKAKFFYEVIKGYISKDKKWVYTIITEPSGSKNGTAAIIPFDNSVKKGNVVIPESVKDSTGKKTYTIVKIADGAFSDLDLTSVTIPKTVNYIGNWAFADNLDMTKVVFSAGSTLNIIDGEAFYNCNLKSITIPKSCTKIGGSAFESNENLSSFSFESGSKIANIYEYFLDGTNVTQISLPDNKNMNIDSDAFAGYEGIVYVSSQELYNKLKEYDCFDDGKAYPDRVILTKYTITYKIPKNPKSKEYDTVTVNNVSYSQSVKLNPSYNTKTFAGYTIKFDKSQNGTGTYSYNQSVSKLTKNGSITLYAILVPNSYNIIYDANGGQGSMNNQIGILYNDNITIRRNKFNNDGMEFKEWNTKPDGTGTSYKEGDMVEGLTSSKSITLYAIWQRSKITIVFDANGGTGKMENQIVEGNSKFKLNKCTFTCEGKVFAGWKEEDKYIIHEDGANIYWDNIPTQTITLYAIWKEPSFKIVFSANGGTGTMDALTIEHNKELKAGSFECTYTKTGYLFIGWQLEDNQGNTYIYSEEEFNSMNNEELYSFFKEHFDVDATVTLNAVWGEDTYSVLFDAGEGEGSMASVQYVYGESSVLPECTFSNTGYVFSGWSTSSGSTDVAYADGGSIKRNTGDGDIKLYAVWTPITYKIAYDANGGYGEMNNSTFTYDTAGQLRTCTFKRAGYSFNGWKTGTDSGRSYRDGAKINNITTKQDDVITLYAQWLEKTITVTFNANGGEVNTTTKLVPTGETCGKLPVPTREGYDFKGWYTSKNGKVQFTSDTKLEEDGDITLYARWEAKKVTINLNAAGGTVKKKKLTVKVGDMISNLPGATKEHYTFDGWWTDIDGGDRVSSSTKATEDITLYAHWKQESTGKIRVSLTVKSLKGAEGYVIEYSKYKDFSNKTTITIKTNSKTTLTSVINNLENGKTYYFRARAYSTKDSKGKSLKKGKKRYSSYGSVVSKKVPKE
jgi:uncharacterized repeat protein (TIGR02543 family)